MSEQNDFERRLSQARQKQGLEEKPEAAAKGALPGGPWRIGLRAGTEVVSALIAGAGLGYLLDWSLGTFPWLFMVFFVVGGAAGVLNVYRLFNPRNSARE